MAKLLVCTCLLAVLTGHALAAQPAAGTQLVEVRVASDDDPKQVTPRLNAIKEAIATNLCAVPVADVHISSVEPEVDREGQVDGSRVVATCTPAAGQLKAVKDACIAGARQTRSAVWADDLNIQNVNCGEAVAGAAAATKGATAATAAGSTTMPAAAATTEALPAAGNSAAATTAAAGTTTPADASAAATTATATTAAAAPAAATAPKSGAGAAAASTVVMALAGAAALMLV